MKPFTSIAPLTEQLAFYRSYHRTPGCKATHIFGVPLVTFSILIPLGWLSTEPAGLHISAAMAFVLITLGYYFLLEPFLATIMTLIMIPMTYAADRVSRLPFGESVAIFAATFILGVVLQLAGHAIEGRKPALMDSFAQAVFSAPLFLLVEGLGALGWKEPRPKPVPPRVNP